MTNRWRPILTAVGLLCISLGQVRSQPPPSSPPASDAPPTVETISRSAMSGAAVAAANAETRITATLGQTAIGPVSGIRISARQGIWYAFPRADPPAEEGQTDRAFAISPNPFSESAQLSFRTERTGNVSLTLYDLLGKPVRTLLDEELAAGTFSLALKGDELASGNYTAVLTADGRQRSLPLRVVK